MSVIVTRAPLRVSLGGGGTDLPSYYREHGGFVISAAIDRYVYMLTTLAFQERFRLKHNAWEEVDDPAEIEHPILRAALQHHWNGRPLEIASVADVPAGTGLGSSGAYAVCLLKALALARGEDASPVELAERACELEIGVLGRTVGKQDQYVAAHGGFRAYTFHPDDTVTEERIELAHDVRAELRDRFLLFFTGEQRSAADQLSHLVAAGAEIERNLHRTKGVARETRAALETGDLDRCAELMEEAWDLKRERSPAAVTDRIAALHERALAAGGRGVMLMGAGGGGFLLVYTADPEATRTALAAAGAPELSFDIEPEGCSGRH